LSLQAISDIWPRREDARAPTRSPQGGRARQNAAKNPADLHAEGNARGGGERAPASEFHPQPSRGRRRRDGGARKASPRRRPRPAASAAGPWPKRGRPSPSEAKRSEGQRSGAAAPRVRGEGRANGRPKGGLRKAAQKGRPRTGGRRRHGGKRGQWGEARPMGGKARSAQWGLDLARQRGETIARDSFFGCPTSSTIFYPLL
jgi:hypothetical protein